ncbi:cyclase family protein [Luteimonas sp. SJ-92]|uniref:Cyclase family protein n=1 Tax=Luteimonas salinisoli TaxID=2752307 RepID=A0A853JBG1_9GAMM|nr:cyclase family protein [Luteimonas salinisoli]NZA25997.1 cyclase family protein [Luteimonas salinisoli]
MTAQHRVEFDFEIEFTNGGGIQGQGFRLDIDGDDIDDAALVDYIVRDLRLLMVGPARILGKRIIAEAHKRNRPAGGRSRAIVELSHVVADGTVTYPGLPAPRICDFLSRERSRELYAHGTEFQIASIDMVANTGTYVDSPFHRYRDGKDLAQMPAEAFADLEAVVVRADHRRVRAIDAGYFRDRELRGRAVLVHTGWDEHWTRPSYAVDHPHLTADAARYLRDCGVRLVGIDSMNIDDTRGRERPVHTLLLGAEIPIVEHLCNLVVLPDDGFRFSALPPRFAGVGTFPVRAIATLRP